MPITDIGRQPITIYPTSTVTVGPDVSQVVADTTNGNFTATLTDFNDTAFHQVAFTILPTDSSGNILTISGNAGAFTTTLTGAGASATIATLYNGTWFISGDVSTISAAAANSRALSAGLAASNATSATASNSLNNSSTSSTATSQNASQSQNISSTGSTSTSNAASNSTNTSTVRSIAIS